MSELVKEWGAAAVAFCLSFAITSGAYAPKEAVDCADHVTVSAGADGRQE